ncbi:MAG: hypothetical protein CMC89_00525 [Flavobacteriaceae bacterium]|nr:hypothetical protein [Flavobacteriaceae bacterium]
MYTLRIKILLFVGLLTNLFYSCDDMDSIHREYLNGEIIYSGKLDTLNVRPGYKRAQIEGYTKFLGNSNKVIVQFDDRSEEFVITGNEGEIMSMIIENLEESSYEFDVQSQDKNGNFSVLQKVAGSAVGDIFVSDQDPRKLIDFTNTNDGTFANFLGNSDSQYVIFTILNYEQENGKTYNDTLFFEQNKIKLIDFKPLGLLKTKSSIQSGLNGVDTIPLYEVNYTLPSLPYSELSKDIIQIVQMPSDITGEYQSANPNKYLFDGDSKWYDDNEKTFLSEPGQIPHHFTIDLGVKTTLRKVKIDMPDHILFNKNNITSLQIWGREDLNNAHTNSSDENDFINAGWKLLHQENIDGENLSSDSFIIQPSNRKVRYIRYRVISTVENISSQLTELTFYGQDNEPITHDKSLHSIFPMQSDNPGNFYGAQPNQYLFDGNSLWSGSDQYGYHSGENAVPGHFTIDLGILTKLRRVMMSFRDPNNYSGNNPTEIEIWGRSNLNDAEILPKFLSSGNNVISQPTSSQSLENAGWKLIKTENINGASVQSHEMNIETNELLRFYKIRYKKTAAGSGCQFIEFSFSGNGALNN